MSAVSDSCAVCGDRATKLRYSHYGATSCFSCRAFFRRAVEKRSHVTYVCVATSSVSAVPGTGFCEISVTTRKKCPACRYQKCKHVGMKHVTAGKAANKETSSSGRRPRPPSSSSSSLASAPAPGRTSVSSVDGLEAELDLCSLEPMLSLEEEQQIQDLVHLDQFHSYNIGEAVCEVSCSAVKEFLTAACTRSSLDFSAICWAYTVGIKKLTRLAQAVHDFNCIRSLDDKKELLMNNLDPMFNIRMGRFFTSEADNFLGQMEHMAIFNVSLMKNCVGWIPPIPRMRWHQFFASPWANSAYHESQYESMMSRIRDMELDDTSATLFSMFTLFNTDTAVLEDPAAVLALQNKYKSLLYRYLFHSKGQAKADKIFPIFMTMMENLREMSNIIKNKTIKLSGACEVPWPEVANLVGETSVIGASVT